MCGECSQSFIYTGFAPAHGTCAFPVYTAQALGCSAGELSEVGLGLCTLPKSKPLRFRFSGTPQRHRFGWACVLCPSQVQVAQVTRCLFSTLLPGGWCLLLPPWSQPLGFLGAQQKHHLRCAMCHLWGSDLWLQPFWQMSTVQDPRKTWLATGNPLTVWWRMPSLGPRLPLFPALAVTCLPLCLRWEMGWSAAG